MDHAEPAKRSRAQMLVLLVMGLSWAGRVHAQPHIGACPVLPSNNIWNTPIDTLPVLPNSDSMVSTIGAGAGFHADFGSGTWAGGPIGIPFITVPGTQAKYPAAFYYASESDQGPYAVPLDVPIEGGPNATGDRHAIAVDGDNCVLYELYRAFPLASSWSADSGAIFDLRSNALRPPTWTSADAAGLPIVPGLITYEEVASGEIRHAIRFTAPQTRREFVWPARHYASSRTGTQYPRMGERFRLKASVNIASYPADVQVILRAMKKYGIMLADNGSAWYVSGKPDARWNNGNLHTLGQLRGSDFEAVDATVLMIDPDSGAAIQSAISVTVSPSSAFLHAGHSQAFTATVTGAPSTVTWSVNGIPGGDAVVGWIDSNGNYLAPSVVSGSQTVTVRATSTASPASAGQASVTILPQPAVSSLSPSPVTAGSFTLTVTGSGFLEGSVVWFNGSALATGFVSSNELQAIGYAPLSLPSVPVVVHTPDGEASRVAYVDVRAVRPAAVSIASWPAAAAVRVGDTVQFSAVVQNGSSGAVIWTVDGVAGGNVKVGTITASGLYRAPASAPDPAVVMVTAIAMADPTRRVNNWVTILTAGDQPLPPPLAPAALPRRGIDRRFHNLIR
jgi:hypothetical protein